MKFILPTGIGDSVWGLHKCQAIRDAKDPNGPIEIYLVGADTGIDSRALDFVRRFDFVNHSAMKSIALHAGSMFRPDGTYNYIEDGWYEFDGAGTEKYCVLIPNAALEHGIRLEDWLPHYEINWNIWRHFKIDYIERVHAQEVYDQIGPFCVFYPGPLNGNTRDGHNRNAIWKPQDWVELGRRIHKEFGLHILVVGAHYDASYFDMLLEPELGHDKSYWTSVIGKTNLGELWALTGMSRFVISYQAGVGIISTYLGTPTGIFWRQHGDSINPHVLLTFNNAMASAWVPPAILKVGTHLPLYYGRDSVDSIQNEIRTRGWAYEESSVQRTPQSVL